MKTIEELRTQHTALVAEKQRLVAEYPAALAGREADRRAFENLARRLNVELPEEIAAANRALHEAKDARGRQRATDWARSSEAASVYQAEIGREAVALAPTAALLLAFEDTLREGATRTAMPPLPQGRVSRLRELAALVIALGRAGVGIDMSKLPPSVAAYIEGAR